MQALPVLQPLCCGPDTPPLPEQARDELAARFKALADPTRVAIVNHLSAADEVCVCNLVDSFGARFRCSPASTAESDRAGARHRPCPFQTLKRMFRTSPSWTS